MIVILLIVAAFVALVIILFNKNTKEMTAAELEKKLEGKSLPAQKRFLYNLAKEGNTWAQYQYALHCSFWDHDYIEAEKWYRQAAANGSTDAMVALADAYGDNNDEANSTFNLLRLGKDDQQSAGWIRKAAENGNVQAMYQLAQCYYFGQTWNSAIEKDYDQALLWASKAAERGDYRACRMLGEIYSSPTSGHTDYKQAFEYYKKAAALSTDKKDRSEYGFLMGSCGSLLGCKKYRVGVENSEVWQDNPIYNPRRATYYLGVSVAALRMEEVGFQPYEDQLNNLEYKISQQEWEKCWSDAGNMVFDPPSVD